TRHGAENTGPDGLALLVHQNGRVAVKPDAGADAAPHHRTGAHDHRTVHIAFFHPAARDGILHADHDDVAHGSGFALRPTKHLDALHPARARVVRHIKICLHLNHGSIPSFLTCGTLYSSVPCSLTLCFLLLKQRGATHLFHHPPFFQLGDGTTFFNPNQITLLAGAVFIMSMVLLGATHHLAHQRMVEAAFHANHHGLVVLVAD